MMSSSSENIKQLAFEFREAIISAKNDNAFDHDVSFIRFPKGCCGDASDLLGQYLLDNDISTWYVCGDYVMEERDEYVFPIIQSHAWLALQDPCKEKNATIIDITGDQFHDRAEYGFYDNAVFVGEPYDFHSLFDVDSRDVHKSIELDRLGSAGARLKALYKEITDRI